MRAQLEAVTEELRRLRSEGVTQVYVGDETMARLRAVVDKQRGARLDIVAEPEPPTEVYDQEAVAPAATPATPRPKFAASPKTATLRWDGKPITPLPAPLVLEVPKGSKIEKMQWLRERVLTCPVCLDHLHPGRKLVFGVGTPEAEIFFCGEGPGAEEEQQGEPFVGPAGELLTKIIQAMGLTREKVYIGNVMKWRPEMPQDYGNREPTPEEVAFSLPFLRAQLDIVRPKAIVALGNTAVSALLGLDPETKMKDYRGKWHIFNGVPLMFTYHPSYLLRNSALSVKRQVWEHMMLVMERVGMPISEKQRGFFLSKS
ncbi:MAG TPA: uracil-DNA glycosylase [Opitutales bacterium]|nr:uracil-DNA glycosylase [Opitutales bacterium]